MSTEKIRLEVLRFRTPQGLPTCAIGLDSTQTCQFYGRAIWGERCILVAGEGEVRKRQGALSRGDAPNNGPGCGYLIPHEKCVVWGVKE